MPPSDIRIQVNTTDGAEMVWIAAGDFIMGSSDADIATILEQLPDGRAENFTKEKPRRVVSLPGYWIYRDPVTVAQYRAYCLAADRSMPTAPEWGWQEDHPIVNVGWNEVSQYAKWANAEIPTEAQWEMAARGDDGRIWPWGNSWIADLCSHSANAASTQPVGSRPGNASPFGARDMAGNVWEWCLASPVGEYDRIASRTPQRRPAATSGHVLRGGSWQSAFPAYFRCAYRCFECDLQRGRDAYHRPTVGFRCVIPDA